ncbi:MAG TPA: aminoglycoside phosphotransferase family protein [Ktedonobacteraceae bacterium]|nr:aminoglycoside phosphotransferase family protein [Ktedonobacteraceae bacterium]
MSLVLPEKFKQNMFVVHGEEKAGAWLERLPTILASCARRWQLTLCPPVANLSFHYVAPALRADGTPVMLKANSPTGEFATEMEAMRLLGESGLARVLEIDAAQEVCLMERLLPGTTLAELVPEQDERATSILAATMRKLWRPAPAGHPFATVEELGKGFERLRARYNGGSGPFPSRLLAEAEGHFAELNAEADRHMLLHGDLHHENVLRAGDEWRVIDARGVVGDPGYEVGLLFYNPMPMIFHLPDLRQILARRVDQLAAELGMERERIRGWGLAQCLLSCWWDIEDGRQELPRDVLACAEIMAEL